MTHFSVMRSYLACRRSERVSKSPGTSGASCASARGLWVSREGSVKATAGAPVVDFCIGRFGQEKTAAVDIIEIRSANACFSSLTQERVSGPTEERTLSLQRKEGLRRAEDRVRGCDELSPRKRPVGWSISDFFRLPDRGACAPRGGSRWGRAWSRRRGP